MSTEMEIPSREANTRVDMDGNLLLMAPTGSNGHEHIINLITDNASSISSSSDQPFVQHPLQQEDPIDQSSSAEDRINLSSSLFMHRVDGYGDHNESSGGYFPCLSTEIIVISSQLILSSLILSLARADDVPTPLFTWVTSYAFGCVATLPTLLWHLWSREWDAGQIPSAHRVSSENNHMRTNGNQPRWLLRMLFDDVTDHFKIVVDFIFAWWFIIGDLWFFEDSPPTQTAAIFRVLIMFLALSCIYYSMPIAMFAILCFCWSPIAHIISFWEDYTHARSRVASSEKFNSLIGYKVEKMLCGHGNSGVLEANEGWILAVGKEKARTIPEEDAFCCICLNEYADNDELTELPCFHVFHTECVDKWLKMNAVCPLCRNEVWPLEEQQIYA